MTYSRGFLKKHSARKNISLFLKIDFSDISMACGARGAGRARFLCFLACFELRGLKKLCYSSVLRSTRH
jgi:hypothetical protein